MEKQTVIKTKVDDLIELLNGVDEITTQEAAKKLGVKEETLQRWIDFLVEEKRVKIEYKLTTPYIMLPKADKKKDARNTIFDSKAEFFEKSLKRGLDDFAIKKLWQKYLTKNLKSIKEVFTQLAREKGLAEKQVNEEWKKFYEEKLR